MVGEIITSDPRLGRRYQEDSRNKNFPICAMLPRKAYEVPRNKIWRCQQYLNQGIEGSCVGHGFAHELIARPFPIQKITHASAVRIYKEAQKLDDWPGESYEGTSVLAGVKALQQLYPGTIESYRWAFDINDIVATLGYHGPIVIGVNWYQGFYSPDVDGIIHATGDVVGGHCLLMRGVDVKKSLFLLHNSWGHHWGKSGTCFISFDDLQTLIGDRGDFCIPVHRGWWRKK